MDINFFKKTRILDGGMGQELLARGMKSNGTLWSANAILNEDYHKLIYEIHKDFVKAGAEIIITNTFTTRRIRLAENDIEEKFEYLVSKAGEIAHEIKKIYPKIDLKNKEDKETFGKFKDIMLASYESDNQITFFQPNDEETYTLYELTEIFI